MKKISIAQGMVDISQKDKTKRVAVATARVQLSREAFGQFIRQGSPKGDVLESAKVAGIMAAKQTPAMIPMCHPLLLSKVAVAFKVDKKQKAIDVFSEVVCLGQTGVEMEALTAATVAALTIYDMMKWSDKNITISDIKLLKKSGGKSGDFLRRESK
ncbi:MAG: cyclic pyranopterin monophosphate synthase MoaC [Candidatus Omnitrophica bacterium]|nr:cyclic pyranopterin monophosphate synthase MoaC [Candidatus Omnitrophota bacterium]